MIGYERCSSMPRRPEVGVVGARLPCTQTAGFNTPGCSSTGRPDHAFKRMWDDDSGYFSQSL